LTERWAVEGSLEFFSVNIPNFGRDGFAGVQGSVLYHLRPPATDRRFVPYLTAGFGNTTTDFTEIPSEWGSAWAEGSNIFLASRRSSGCVRKGVTKSSAKITESFSRLRE